MQQIRLDRDFQRLALDKAMMILVDEYCTAETAFRDYGRPIHANTYQKMQDLTTEEIFCPKCRLYQKGKQVAIQDTIASESYVDKEKKAYLKRYSIYNRREAPFKGFAQFHSETAFEKEVYQKARRLAGDLADGQNLNVILTGPPGSGKTHLGTAILYNVNEISFERGEQLTCLYVEFGELLNRINADFDKRQELLDTIRLADVVMIDDVGAEVGKLQTERTASDHAYRTFKEILDAREGIAATIVTTNLSITEIERLYDARLSSRLKHNHIRIDFAGISDKRSR